MANELTTLLASPTLSRSTDDYERVCNDFVRFAGGVPMAERFPIPAGLKNADYHFDLDELEIILELKQLRAYDSAKTVDQYFQGRIAAGRVRSWTPIGPGRVQISPDSLSVSDWNHFYKSFRSRVPETLKSAARQLKDTEKFLPASGKRRIKGVLLVNTGDYNLSINLMGRLVEWKVRREWKAGHFSAVDFVMCGTFDLFRESRNLLHGRHIVRTMEDTQAVAAITHLYDRWVRYGAAAVGATVEYQEGASMDAGVDPEPYGAFSGKVRWLPNG